ncbi:MAG: transposase [Phycisphaerae bacterium]|nr:transposase [Phycisphaerae bacterium]
MSKIIGYMLTWTTYGTWLPGDQRGYVADDRTLPGNGNILERNRKRQKSPAVKLNAQEKKIVEQTILAEAKTIGQQVESLVVCSNHVHLLTRRHARPVEEVVSRYKSMTTRGLWKEGRKGRVWTKGYDKRFCFTEQDIATKAKYIQNHND